jgi:diguanylate cyclase (GGDEF)-like protein
MVRKSAPRPPGEEAGRETRLKLILLAFALVLVAGYALTVTEMGEQTLQQAGALLHSDTALLTMAALGGAVAISGLAYLFLRGRGASKDRHGAIETAVTVANIAGRKEFLERLAREVEANGKSGLQLALHIIDIDRFHVVNAVRGEAEGDDFLRLLTERLLLLVNHADRIGRIGDDEFAILQPEVGGSRHAEIFARRIQETVKDACAQVPRHARPGASIGIAVAPDHGDAGAKLLHSAGLALRAAKDGGGDAFRIYSREMEMLVEARLQMEKAISDGLQQSWFELHFQPQYDLGARRLTGFEALVRMNHPELGELLPGVFVPIADESGLIHPLGDWIIRDAFATAREWPPHLALSINISLAQFRHGDIANTIINALARSGLPATRLKIEISEGVLLARSDAINEQLRRLKTRGVTIVLDDFGLESSRLKLLSRSVLDAVKLDRTLVERLGAEPETESLARSLIGTARSFELDILAEGIERAEQAHFLMSNGIRKVQGYLFGRPARKVDLAPIIAKDMRNAMERSHPSPRPSIAAA